MTEIATDPSREIIIEKLHAALAQVTHRDAAPIALAESTRLREDLGLDSYAAIELLFELEDLAGVRIPQQAAASFQTVGDVVSFVLTELSRAPGGQAASAGNAGVT